MELKELLEIEGLCNERQREVLQAVIEHGGVRSAARHLDCHHSVVGDMVKRVKERAARLGHAIGHFSNGVAPGYLMGKVTVQRGASGEIERTWERQSPDDEAKQAAFLEAMEGMAEALPREAQIKAKKGVRSDKLLNMFTLTDCHVGMLAWHREGGADWDLKIAEDTLVSAFAHMIHRAPDAHTAIINQLGDFLHFDGLEAVTPANRHILDADGRFHKISRVAVRILRRVINLALETHDQVHVICAEGNHDMASANWLTIALEAVYENNPRVTFDDSPLPFYAYRHGNVMLGFHHGHTRGRESLPLLFAQQFRDMWGKTEHSYIHTGHRHHMDEKDSMGVRLIQHSTLAARDAYAARHGYHAARLALAITYHKDYGEWSRITVTPDMITDT